MFVMLKRDWPGNFRRSVRDPNGEIVHQYEFAPGLPVEIEPGHEKSLAGDIGKALIEVNAIGKSIKGREDKPVDADAAVQVRRLYADLEAAANHIDKIEDQLREERRQNSELSLLVEQMRAKLGETTDATPPAGGPAGEVSTVEGDKPVEGDVSLDATAPAAEETTAEEAKPAKKRDKR